MVMYFCVVYKQSATRCHTGDIGITELCLWQPNWRFYSPLLLLLFLYLIEEVNLSFALCSYAFGYELFYFVFLRTGARIDSLLEGSAQKSS